MFWLLVPYVLQSLERQKDGVLKVLGSTILKVFFNLNNFVILKIIVVANVLEKRTRPWWFSHVTSVWPVPQQNQVRLCP